MVYVSRAVSLPFGSIHVLGGTEQDVHGIFLLHFFFNEDLPQTYASEEALQVIHDLNFVYMTWRRTEKSHLERRLISKSFKGNLKRLLNSGSPLPCNISYYM